MYLHFKMQVSTESAIDPGGIIELGWFKSYAPIYVLKKVYLEHNSLK